MKTKNQPITGWFFYINYHKFITPILNQRQFAIKFLEF